MALTSLAILFTIFVLVTITLAMQVLPVSTPKHKRIVTRLIHYQSSDSPYYNSSASVDEISKRDLEISYSRIKYLRGISERKEGDSFTDENLKKNGSKQAIISTTTLPLFLVIFQIGSPRVYQAVAMDTGSTLPWIHCDGLDTPFYNPYIPEKSSTYSKYVRCDKYCGGNIHCFDDCGFKVSYASHQYASGKFASDRWFIKTPMASEAVLDDVVFGCSKSSNFHEASGILGLNAGRASLISQLGYTQFSYCLSNLTRGAYQSDALILGENFNIGGLPTPLIIEDSQYYVNMEGISFGGQMLDIDKQILRKKTNGRGGALFDSGTSITLLQKTAYLKLEAAIVNFMDDRLEMEDFEDEEEIQLTCCFVGNLYRDFIDFPLVTFHFDGGARMELDKENVFRQVKENLVCLNMAAADNLFYPHAIIGVNIQQYFYTAFDLAKKELSFQRIGCEFLWNA